MGNKMTMKELFEKLEGPEELIVIGLKQLEPGDTSPLGNVVIYEDFGEILTEALGKACRQNPHIFEKVADIFKKLGSVVSPIYREMKMMEVENSKLN